jgi:general secretion pathway protein G
MKFAFSLLELIFAIVILGIVASVAVPKYLDTKDSALISTIKRDISTTVSSIQSYYLLNQKIEKIDDAITLNDLNWIVEDTKITDKNSCLSVEIKTSEDDVKTIELEVDETKDSTICVKIRNSGLESSSYPLY